MNASDLSGGQGFIKNGWHLKPASTALGCELSREKKNSLGLISGPKLRMASKPQWESCVG